jgi:uncharacterized membrane protein YbhN (UPF0104 family)
VTGAPRHRVHRALAVVGVGILAAAVYWVGIDVVVASLTRLTAGAAAIALVAIVIGTLLGAWNCYRIADLRTTLSFRSFLPVFWRSWAVGITLPGQVGDFVTTLWQLKGRAVDLDFVAGRLIADKVITLLLMLALVAFVPLAIGAARPLTSALILLGLVAGITILVFVIAWCRRHPAVVARSRLGKRALAVLEAAVVPPRLAIGNALVTCAKLLASGCAYWAVLETLTPQPPGLASITIISQTAGLVAYVPISFNGLGTVELSAIALFGAAGVEAAAVVSTYVALRLITMATAWLPALFLTAFAPSTNRIVR